MRISGSSSRWKKTLPAVFAACLFVLVLTAKWATFERYGSPMPDWDQWDAEALETLVPWFTGNDFFGHLFQPHNEHRVVLTKLQTLALVLLNGQWDARLQCVVNAALHAALATAFWLFALRCLRSEGSEGSEHSQSTSPPLPLSPSPSLPRLPSLLPALLFLLTCVLFGLPLAWQNVLGGFHSQQYWLLGLSFAAIVSLPFARSWSAAWWIGAVSTLLALGSMASGFLAALTVAIVITFRLFRRETTARETWPALAVCAVSIAVGVFTRHEFPGHHDIKAQNASDFVFTIVHSLQWPWRDRHWAALVLWLPWFLLGWRVLCESRAGLRPAQGGSETRPTLDHRHAQTILALGGWVLLQLAATAYARGVGADYPASRYMDTLTFGTMANALAHLLTRPLSPSLPLSVFRAVRALLALAWLVTLGLGLNHFLTRIVRVELDQIKGYHVNAERNMRRYLATNDPQHLAGPDIPFPSAEGLIDRLAHPGLRALMPAPIRTPLAVTAAPAGPSPFLENNAVNADPDRPPRLGLSRATPPLDHTRTWGSHHATQDAERTGETRSSGLEPTGQWRSAPLTASLGGWLEFEVAGHLGDSAADITLCLRDAATDAFLVDIVPSRIPGDTWRSAHVRAPREPFVIAATDNSPRHWLAFSPPVEMGGLSHYAWLATKHALTILALAVSGTLVLVSLTWGRRNVPRWSGADSSARDNAPSFPR